MFFGLRSFLNGIGKAVKRDDVLTVYNMTNKAIIDDVIPSIDHVVKSKEAVVKDSVIIKNLNVMKKPKAKDGIAFFKDIEKMFNNLTNMKITSAITDLISNELSEFITPRAATAKDVAIMKLVSDITIMTQYTLDLIYISLVDEANNNMPEFKKKSIRGLSTGYVNLINIYSGDINKMLENIKNTADVDIARNDVKGKIIDKMLKNKGKTYNVPDTSNFLGNPIYHIRMWLVDLEIEKYELLKEKKKLVELKLLELKLKQKNEKNPKLEQQIEYYEDKVARLEYKIKEIESDDESATSYIPIVM